MSYAVSITEDGTRLETAGKYVDQDIVVGMSDSIKKTAATYTPGTTDQTIAAGQYLSGAQTVKGDANLIAGNIRNGKSIFGVDGNLTPGITPTGTKSITENGTYDVTQFANAAVAVRNGTHNRHFEAVNPASITGYNFLTVVTADPVLKSVRAYNSLFVLYKCITDATVSCVFSGMGENIKSYYAIHSDGNSYQYVYRYASDGSINSQYSLQPIYSGDSITYGSGRVYITPDGDLRIYSNTSGYAIPAGKIIIDVLWGDD